MIIEKVGGLYDDLAKGRTTTTAQADGNNDGDDKEIMVIDGKGNAIIFNAPRFLNVMFSDKMVPLIAQRGANLTKDDLENKKKVDQELFTTLIVEYNDDTNKAYGTHAFKNIPQKVDPAIFRKIPRTAWRNALQKFKDFVKEYEEHIRAWTKSGNHGRFDELTAEDLKVINPDIDKCTSKYMIYMHYYMQLHHELLSTCVALLPRDVARRSTTPREMSSDNTGRFTKESRIDNEGGEKEGGKYVGKASGMQKALGSIATKNEAQQTKKIELDMIQSEKQTAMTASLTLSNQIKEEKKTKRELEDRLRENCGRDRSVVNEKIRAVMAKLSSASTSTSRMDAETAEDEDDADDFLGTERLSQESLIIDILDSGKKIKKWTRIYNVTEKDMEACFLPSNKENGTENA